ncbi:MAG: hypothetical protein ACOZQL_01010 [Myxococcota bacterium]
MSTEPDFEELVRHLEGELTQSRAREIEGSPRLAHLKEKLAELGSTDPALEQIDLVPAVHAALAAPPPSRSRRLLAPLIAVAAAAALVVAGWRDSAREDEFRPRGGTVEENRWAGLEVYRVVGGRSVRAGGSIAPTDGLAFAYRNGGEHPWPFLMVFAVDARGRTYWFHPAWTEPAEAPRSIAIVPSTAAVELREVVFHDFAPGPLEVHALFSRQPLTVLAVERGLADLEKLPDVLDQRQSLVVSPP